LTISIGANTLRAAPHSSRSSSPASKHSQHFHSRR
jgi:hypothetical protein